MERIVAFAGDYAGDYGEDIILGANVMNNWEMIINNTSVPQLLMFLHFFKDKSF